VKIYSMFSGLGLPANRISVLREEVKASSAATKTKEDARNMTLTLDTGNETISAAQKIKDKISAKSSTFGKMTSNQVIDRRK
jgi:hypothetical protein